MAKRAESIMLFCELCFHIEKQKLQLSIVQHVRFFASLTQDTICLQFVKKIANRQSTHFFADMFLVLLQRALSQVKKGIFRPIDVMLRFGDRCETAGMARVDISREGFS